MRLRVLLIIFELKRQLGDGSYDPSAQAGLSMRRSWIRDEVSLIFYLFSQKFHSDQPFEISAAALP